MGLSNGRFALRSIGVQVFMVAVFVLLPVTFFVPARAAEVAEGKRVLVAPVPEEMAAQDRSQEVAGTSRLERPALLR